MNLAISTSLYPLRMFGSKFPEKEVRNAPTEIAGKFFVDVYCSK